MRLLCELVALLAPTSTALAGSIAIAIISLPQPSTRGVVSVEEALAARRSVRKYSAEPLLLREISQLLWAAYGITDRRRELKTTPSAGATYPLLIYLIAYVGGIVMEGSERLREGSYLYDPLSHSISLVREGDLAAPLYEACLRQPWVYGARAVITITAIYERTTSVYGERGVRYVHMEAGHAAQNIYLQATALGLATVAVAAFYDEMVREVIGASPDEEPLYVMPIGRRRR